MIKLIERFLQVLLVSTIMVMSVNLVIAQTAQEIAKSAFHSTVLLVMEDANLQPLALGSGFLVGKDQVASNLHVVEGASGGYVKITGQKGKYNIDGILAIDYKRDLVILKISGLDAPTLELGDSKLVQVGETVYAVGNPQGLEGTFSQGIVSGIRESGTDKLLQITAPISPGSSGGPVLSAKGEVVGVSVATYTGGQNLNFAIPSLYLKELVGQLGPLQPLSEIKPIKNQRSIFEDLGGRSTDGVEGVQLTWTLPQNKFSGGYSFSLRNKLREAVVDVYCLVVFKDSQGFPIEIDVVTYDGVIPAGLAKRVNSDVDGSIGVLTNWNASAVEFRILDFKIAD